MWTMIECPGCGGNLKFDIATQLMKCAYCDAAYEPYDIQKEEDAKSDGTYETKVFTCPQCGGEILSEENEAATFCLYCGSSTILTERISQEKCPDYIIPFRMTKEDCKNAYMAKMKKSFFVPKEYKSKEFLENFRGVYMPYWSYQVKQENTIHVKGKETHQSGDYRITTYYDLAGDLEAGFEGDSYDASQNFYDDISQRLAPFDFRVQKPFTPAFLSGFYADTADVESDEYVNDTMALADAATMRCIREEEELSNMTLTNETATKLSFRTSITKVNRTMYPVWFMSYRNGDRIAYATVNGQTGKVVADMPVDKKKYTLCSFLLAIPIFLVLNLLFTFNPKENVGLCALVLLISLILYVMELKSIYQKENFEYARVNRRQKLGHTGAWRNVLRDFAYAFPVVLLIALPFVYAVPLFRAMFDYINIGMWFFFLMGVGIASWIAYKETQKLADMNPFLSVLNGCVAILVMIIMFVAPVHDLWYYGMSLILLLTMCANFFMIMNKYNRLATRILPQLNRKGGEYHV